MNKSILFTIFIFFISGCSGYPPKAETDMKFSHADQFLSDSLIDLSIFDNDSLITIKLPEVIDDPYNTFQISDWVESVRYVPLETSKESLISGIEKSVIHGGFIYILDNLGKAVLLFDLEGKFIRKIGRSGKGPNEYINPINFMLDEKKQELYVLDDTSSKFFVYNLQGDFKREEKINFRMSKSKLLNDSTYVISTDVCTNFHLAPIANYKLILTNRRWEILARGYPYDAVNNSTIAFTRDGLYAYQDQILYNPNFSYYVYTITSSGLKPKYFIDAGEYALPDNFDYKLSWDEFHNKYDTRNSKYAYIDSPIIETDDFVLTTLRYQWQHIHLFYAKRSSTVGCNLYSQPIPDKFVVLTPIKGWIKATNKFYGFVNALELNNKVDFYVKLQEQGFIVPSQELRSIADNDNPILAFYKFKEP